MQISEAFLEMKDDPCGGNSDGSVVKGFGDELVPAGIFFAGFHGVQQQTGHIRCHAQPHNILPQRQARAWVSTTTSSRAGSCDANQLFTASGSSTGC